MDTRYPQKQQYSQPKEDEAMLKIKREQELLQEQQKLQQTRQESSKKNFMDAFRSVKNIFSNTQPTHTQEDDEPVKSQSIFAGSMGLFATPTDISDSFVSSAFDFGRSDYGAVKMQNEYDAMKPYSFGYDRPATRPSYPVNEVQQP